MASKRQLSYFVGGRHALLALALLSVLSACGPAVQNITVKSAEALSADPAQATLVIVQPTTRFQSVNILDQDGRLIAQLNDRSHTLLRLPAGPRRLYATVEKQAKWGDRIEGTFEAGRTYYATISLRWGGVSFLALNPRSNDQRWSQKEKFLSTTPRVQMDPSKTALASQQLGDPTSVLQNADAYVAKLDEAHRAEHLIRAEDGI